MIISTVLPWVSMWNVGERVSYFCSVYNAQFL